MIKVQAGDKFTAIIHGKKADGVIQIQFNDVYLCQNKSDGSDCFDKLGYKYSWFVSTVENFNEDSLSSERVMDFQLLPNRKSRIESLEL